jgi:hypothetical protein
MFDRMQLSSAYERHRLLQNLVRLLVSGLNTFTRKRNLS